MTRIAGLPDSFDLLDGESTEPGVECCDCYHDSMIQLTLRVPEKLGEDLKSEAAARSMSVNRFAGAVLAAAVDPDLDETEMGRLRGRLKRAGLLEKTEPSAPVRRPDPDRVKAARSRAGHGRPLSDLVSEGRG